MVLWKKTMVLWRKLWYYGQNFGTIPKAMELRFTKGKTWYITKTCETLIYDGTNNGNVPKTIEVFEQINTLRTLIYYGKTMVLWKKLWYYSKL